MPTPTKNLSSLAAVAGGAAFAVLGAIQVTQDFGGTHNTIDSTGEYIVTAGFAAGLLLTIPIFLLLAGLARTPKAGAAITAALGVLGVMSASSVVMGEDAAFFNAVAPVALLTWLVSSVLIARGLRRTGAVPAAVAYALPLTAPVTVVLSPIGGALLTGAFWIAVGSQLQRGALAPAPAAA